MNKLVVRWLEVSRNSWGIKLYRVNKIKLYRVNIIKLYRVNKIKILVI